MLMMSNSHRSGDPFVAIADEVLARATAEWGRGAVPAYDADASRLRALLGDPDLRFVDANPRGIEILRQRIRDRAQSILRRS